MIIDKLIDRIIELQNPTVVGLDPDPSYIPPCILKNSAHIHSDPMRALMHAIFIYNKMIMDALHTIVPAVKPQMAFYEQYGAEGVACYIKTIEYAKKMGFIVICDIKRSDIASSAIAYANAYLGEVDLYGHKRKMFDADFITLNPYLGYDAVEPLIKQAREYDKGVFLLIKTSNPGAGDIQDIETNQGKVYEIVADKVSKWGAGEIGSYGYSRVCAVVGATHPGQAEALRKKYPNIFFLVPGFGAQGGGADDAAVCFNPDGLGAIVNSARGIIAAYAQPGYKERMPDNHFDEAAKEAAIKMRDELCQKINMPKEKM